MSGPDAGQEAAGWSAGWDWRACLEGTLAPDEVAPVIRRGAADPGWEELRARSYPDRLVLSALACEPETKAGLRRMGIGHRMRVLDAACGPGVISRFLLDLGAAQVVGIDVGSDMLARAESLPRPAGSGQELRFERADVRSTLPYPDASFDAVVYSDIWVPEAFGELRRVLRPGGAIVIRSTHALASTYSWDAAFDLRIRMAAVDAYDRTTRAGADPDHAAIPEPGSDADARTHLGRLLDLGPWSEMDVFTIPVERRSPLPEVFDEHLRQSFGCFTGPLIRDLLAPDDLERVVALYEPASPSYVFRRDDLHVLQLLTFVRVVP